MGSVGCHTRTALVLPFAISTVAMGRVRSVPPRILARVSANSATGLERIGLPAVAIPHKHQGPGVGFNSSHSRPRCLSRSYRYPNPYPTGGSNTIWIRASGPATTATDFTSLNPAADTARLH